MTRLLRTLAALVAAFALPASAFNLDTSNPNPTHVTGLWWNAAESGWGAAVTQQGNVIFVAMFVYDASGNPTWYVASNCAVSGGGCTGDLYRVRGGRAPTTGWSGANVSPTRVGSLSLAFNDNNNGTMVYTIDGASGQKSIVRQLFGGGGGTTTPPPPTGTNLSRTEQLIGGTWTFSYSIGSSPFTDRYTLTSIIASGIAGEYLAAGTDEFGNPVAGGWVNNVSQWVLLDPGVVIDQFYTFTFSDLNHISGCYYQIVPPGSQNLSQCFALTGIRSPFKMKIQEGFRPDPMDRLRAMPIDAQPGETDPAVIDAYLEARRKAR